MKKSLLATLSICFVFSSLGALAQSSLLGNQKVTPQSYQQVGSKPAETAKAVTPTTAVPASSAGLEKVKQMLQAAQQRADQKRAAAIATMPTSAVSPSAAATASGDDWRVGLSQLNQVSLLYRQQTNLRLEELQSTNSKLESKVNDLNNVLGLLNQELSKLQAQMETVSASKEQRGLPTLMNKPWMPYAMFATLTFLLAVIIMLLWQRPRSNKDSASSVPFDNTVIDDDDTDTEAEYDFMGSAEGMPAKLDLARAYLAMDDLHAAKHALEQVIANGNDIQRNEAQDLLEKIIEKS